jgi:phosphohistidine phosphatase
MSPTIQLAGIPSQPIGLEMWMQRVLERAEKVSKHWHEDDIHDLRVALRRCRAMAEALSQVNPDPVWRKMKKSTRVLFHALGELRDTQVERVWLRKLWPGRHPVRVKLMRQLGPREKMQRSEAEKALSGFDAKSWKKWSRKVAKKAEFFPVESIVFQRLALGDLNECARLFERARKRPSATVWHRARIALKHFRYVSENFLPRRYEAWARDVKRMQDLLGEVHDLDVLKADIRKIAGAGFAQQASQMENLQNEKAVRLAEVTAKITGPRSVLALWRGAILPAHPLSTALLPQQRSA